MNWIRNSVPTFDTSQLDFLTHFLIRWPSTLFGACFLRIMCPLVGCHDALSPTEVAGLDVLMSIILDVLRCNRDLNVSVKLSLELLHLLL